MTGDEFGRTASPRNKNRSSNLSLVTDHASLQIQSLSGWDGVFNNGSELAKKAQEPVAIPFRVGWGFQPVVGLAERREVRGSQSLSGWGGVFNLESAKKYARELLLSQSLSGWGGDKGSDE